MVLHLVMYSNGQPYTTTKHMTLDTISLHTSRNVIIHDYTLERIRSRPWFSLLETLPDIHRSGQRDGYYNSWKAFIVKDVYDMMNEGDLLYYVDSSKYFISGFTENIDRLCEISDEIGGIFGSVGDNVRNDSFGCCDKLSLWNHILKSNDNSNNVTKRHVLNSWFTIKKTSANTPFIEDWASLSVSPYDESNEPAVTSHHTGDQSIFNILVVKYGMPVFYSPDIRHDDNKNKNTVLQVLNNSADYSRYIIRL